MKAPDLMSTDTDRRAALEAQRNRLRARWRAVEVHKARELAAMTDDRAREIILSLGAAEAWRERPDWSGLVTQQALFHKGRTW